MNLGIIHVYTDTHTCEGEKEKQKNTIIICGHGHDL